MGGAGWAGVYCLSVLIGAALIAPWLYWLAQALGQHVAAIAALTSEPFHRFVNRTMLVLAIAGAFPLMRKLDLRTWTAAGLSPTALGPGKFGAGFLAGFASLAVVAGLTIATGVRQWNTAAGPGEIASAITAAAASAIVVALIEELVFRGALFGGLRKKHTITTAILLSSAIYAAVHFFARPIPPASVDWWSGFTTLAGMLSGLVDFERIVPAFFSLFLAGLTLAWAYHRTGTLYFSIGLHAGWIFWMKSFRSVTVSGNTSNSPFWGSGKMIDGWLAVITMGLLFLILRAWRRRPEIPHGA